MLVLQIYIKMMPIKHYFSLNACSFIFIVF